jgi:hypothetical protein
MESAVSDDIFGTCLHEQYFNVLISVVAIYMHFSKCSFLKRAVALDATFCIELNNFSQRQLLSVTGYITKTCFLESTGRRLRFILLTCSLRPADYYSTRFSLLDIAF